MHGAPFSEHWAPALRLRSPGLAKCSILDALPHESGFPLGLPFSPLGVTFSLGGVSDAENFAFFGAARFEITFFDDFWSDSGASGQKRGYRMRGVAKITVSPTIDFGEVWGPFWRSLWL